MHNNKLNFSYIIPHFLAGMARPGKIDSLNEDLDYLQKLGIKAIISLTETAINQEAVKNYGFHYMHIPVDDFTAPSLNQVLKCMEFIDMMNQANKAVVIHCFAGYGRTGTMLACYLVKQGENAIKAIERVRNKRPLSIQVKSQVEKIFEYEDYINNDHL